MGKVKGFSWPLDLITEVTFDLGKYSFWGTMGVKQLEWVSEEREERNETVIVDNSFKEFCRTTENDVEDDEQLGQESVLVWSSKQQHVYMPVRTLFQQPGGNEWWRDEEGRIAEWVSKWMYKEQTRN